MRRHLIKKFFDKKFLENEKSFSIFGELIHDQHLWYMRRRSVAGACAIGLFCAFMPIPFQMLLAAGLAIIFRYNLPISVALVWVTNPITASPLFFLAYKIGTFLTETNLGQFEFELSLDWLFTELRERWKPFLAGCLFMGIVTGLSGFIVAHVMWRIRIVLFLSKRKSRSNKKQDPN